MKTPAPQRAAGRKRLAAQGKALPGGEDPIPNLDYLKRAIRSVGRLDPSKRPAAARLIRKRAKQLGATNTPGVKGTWAFQAANDGTAVELAGPHGYIHGWIKVGAEPGSDQTSSIEWLKSGKTNWAARSNAYTIERGSDGQHILRDGHGRQVGESMRSLPAAKAAAQRHQDRAEPGGAADEHIAKAKQADAEGRHADAINHLGAAINATTDQSAAFHLTELKKEMAARAMGVPYKAQPLPKRLHAMANDSEALEMSSYVAPHMPAGSPAGGQFGTTSGGGGKQTPAQQHAAHDAHLAHLQHLVDTGKATPAQKAELAAAKKKAAAPGSAQVQKALAAVKAGAAATPAPKAKKAKAPAKPKVNKTKGTVTATVGGKKVTMTLHQWHQLHAAHEKAIKAANDTEAIEMATATPRKMPMVRGAADVQLRRTGPGMITVQHKSTGMKVGTITPKGNGWQGMHATGTMTGASGSQQGALTGLIAFHNQMAAKAKASGFPPAQQDGTAVMPGSKTYTAEQDAVDLAGALPVSTPASSSSDGPRVTSMGSGKPAAAPAGSPSGLSPYAAAIYRKFLAKKMKPAVALAFAKRADAMHAKAAGPKASAA